MAAAVAVVASESLLLPHLLMFSWVLVLAYFTKNKKVEMGMEREMRAGKKQKHET